MTTNSLLFLSGTIIFNSEFSLLWRPSLLASFEARALSRAVIIRPAPPADAAERRPTPLWHMLVIQGPPYRTSEASGTKLEMIQVRKKFVSGVLEIPSRA
jgi:hypothetical protein